MSEKLNEHLEEVPEKIESSDEENLSSEERRERILKKFEEELKQLMENTKKEAELYRENPQEWERINKAKEKEIELGKRKERTEKTTNEKLKKSLEFIGRDGTDVNSDETIIEFGYAVSQALNKLFGQKYNLSVPEDEMPHVLPFDTEVPFYVSSYKDDKGVRQPLKVIAVGTINHILNGNLMSEELAHFYRFNLQPEQDNENLTHEFFGFLGRKMFKKAVAGDTELADLDNDEGQEISGRKMVMEILRGIREIIRLLKKQKEVEQYDFRKEMIQKDIDKHNETREDILTHQKGYEYAFNVDINQIQDWQKLFSMPNEEVRKRFFTPKPDYSGL